MTTEHTLVVRADWQPTRKLSPNAGIDKRYKTREVNAGKSAMRDAAERAVREARDAGRVWTMPRFPVLDVIILWGKGARVMDSDNALASCKCAVDGLAGALGIDDKVFLTSHAFQGRDPRKTGATIMRIREANADERELHAMAGNYR